MGIDSLAASCIIPVGFLEYIFSFSCHRYSILFFNYDWEVITAIEIVHNGPLGTIKDFA